MIACFTDELIGLVPVPGSDDFFYPDRPVAYEAGDPAGGWQRIVVPARFITDLASVPRFARGIINTYGRHVLAAVLHDWLYSLGDRAKEVCDAVFSEAMAASKTPRRRRMIMAGCVFVCGGSAWRGHRRLGHSAKHYRMWAPELHRIVYSDEIQTIVPIRG